MRTQLVFWTKVNLGSDLWLWVRVVTDEDTNSITNNETNMTILGNVAMQVMPPSASGPIYSWWPNLQPMRKLEFLLYISVHCIHVCNTALEPTSALVHCNWLYCCNALQLDSPADKKWNKSGANLDFSPQLVLMI